MRVQQVMFPSGQVRCAADLYLPDGVVALAVDYRTIGSSEGQPRGQWLPQWQVDDLRAGVSYLRGRPEVDPERIGLWGHSTAAGVAIVAGVLDPRGPGVARRDPPPPPA